MTDLKILLIESDINLLSEFREGPECSLTYRETTYLKILLIESDINLLSQFRKGPYILPSDYFN